MTMTSEIVNNNDGSHFFEGVEKLLEIWFSTPGQNKVQESNDLRKIPRKALEEILKLARCGIISAVSNSEIDAYVLSESSMFISKNRFILKTCGTTTLLLCLPTLLLAVEQYTEFRMEKIFYSHKNYERPELQIGAHQEFKKEVELLDGMFAGGTAYRFGTTDNDCWNLYMLCRSDSPIEELNPDQTLEVIMFDLDPNIMSLFTNEKCSDGPNATEKSGIDEIIPGMVIDSFLFEPCGYSMNGITAEGYYMTIHITPETGFSYVSFETNIPVDTFRGVIDKVLDVFRPNKFVITLMQNSSTKFKTEEELQNWATIKTWNRDGIQHRISENYGITYAKYSSLPS